MYFELRQMGWEIRKDKRSGISHTGPDTNFIIFLDLRIQLTN
jgi:hypothetical protein